MSNGAARRQTAIEWAAEHNAASGQRQPARDLPPETADDIADRQLGVRALLKGGLGYMLDVGIPLPPEPNFSIGGRGWAPHTFVLEGDEAHGTAGRKFEFMWQGRTHDGVHEYQFLRERH